MPLPNYNDCEWSLFISYAHLDDRANNRWISQLKTVLHNRLFLLPRHIPVRNIHFSGEEGLLTGDLAVGLREDVQKSFAMLVVVGAKYAESGWCESELKAFQDIFGADGHRGRLYIVVMREDDLTAIQASETWRAIAGNDVCIEMFDPEHRNQPLQHVPEHQQPVPAEFCNRANRIADRLISEISANYSALTLPKLVSAEAAAPLQVVVGPWTPGLAPVIEPLVREIGATKKAMVHCATPEMLPSYDPDDPQSVGPAITKLLTAADALVLPLTDERPLRAEIAGGHATLMQQEWTKLGTRRPIVWYRPEAVAVEAADRAKPRHLEAFQQLVTSECRSSSAVVNELLGAGEGNAIRLGIEDHDRSAFFSLADELNSVWDGLRDRPEDLKLKCVPVPIGRIAVGQSFDVAGVVLLFYNDLTSAKSLKDQELSVERQLPKPGAYYPGLVAAIFEPPPDGEVPEHDWLTVRFNRTRGSDSPRLDGGSKARLEDFFRVLCRQHANSRRTATH